MVTFKRYIDVDIHTFFRQFTIVIGQKCVNRPYLTMNLTYSIIYIMLFIICMTT